MIFNMTITGTPSTKSIIIISIDSGSTVAAYSDAACTTLVKAAVEKSSGEFWITNLDNGTYYIKATKGSDEAITSYTISEYGVYRISMDYWAAYINATFSTDALSLICSDGVTTINASGDLSGGAYTFTVKNTGTWTITASNGGDTVSNSVIVDLQTTYSLTLPSLFPAAYQKVAYIESSGTQWIDTGITPNTTTISRIKFINLEATGSVIYGYNPNDTSDYRLFNYNNAYYFDAPSNKRITGGTLKAGTTQELELGNYYVKNLVTSTNIISSSTPYVFNGIATITLNGNNGISKNRWYYVFIYDSDIPLAELYPCYRISDSVAGMWDKVSNTFLTNQGTGSFTVGPDV